MARMTLTLPKDLKCEDVERRNTSFPRLSGINETMRRCREMTTPVVFLELYNKLFQNIVLCVTG